MTEYFLVNDQDYFAFGYTVSNGQVYVETTGGLETAVSCKADDPQQAKANMYQQVLAHPAPQSERTTLTAGEQQRVTAKLDASFKPMGTDQLSSC